MISRRKKQHWLDLMPAVWVEHHKALTLAYITYKCAWYYRSETPTLIQKSCWDWGVIKLHTHRHRFVPCVTSSTVQMSWATPARKMGNGWKDFLKTLGKNWYFYTFNKNENHYLVQRCFFLSQDMKIINIVLTFINIRSQNKPGCRVYFIQYCAVSRPIQPTFL